MHRSLLIFGLLFGAAASAFAQARPTASRLADIQVGADYSFVKSDYTANWIRGYGFYGTIDWTEHFGIDAEFHQANDPQPTKLYERSYEIGGRYVRHYGRLNPYARVMYGRGVFNFPADCRDNTTNFPVSCTAPNVNPATYVASGNLAYNMIDFGAGLDYHITRRINFRADYEYQKWFSGLGLANGLSPQLITIGVAYHFPAGNPREIRK